MPNWKIRKINLDLAIVAEKFHNLQLRIAYEPSQSNLKIRPAWGIGIRFAIICSRRSIGDRAGIPSEIIRTYPEEKPEGYRHFLGQCASRPGFNEVPLLSMIRRDRHKLRTG